MVVRVASPNLRIARFASLCAGMQRVPAHLREAGERIILSLRRASARRHIHRVHHFAAELLEVHRRAGDAYARSKYAITYERRQGARAETIKCSATYQVLGFGKRQQGRWVQQKTFLGRTRCVSKKNQGIYIIL